MPDPRLDLADRVDELTAAFVAASRRSLDWFGRPVDVANKHDAGFDPVTAADRAVEDLIRSEIHARFPDHVVIGEERGRIEGAPSAGPADVSVEWIVDPIDGTRAFITGRPMWGSLVGVVVDGIPLAGWMHLPVLDQTYVGFDGRTTLTERGSTRTIVTADTAEVADAVLFSTHPSMFVEEADRAAFAALEGAAKLSRFDGDCANYGLLASGFGDLVVENQLQPYDILPLVPIVEGAGGLITDLDGGPVASGWAVAAANATIHREALALLGEHTTLQRA